MDELYLLAMMCSPSPDSDIHRVIRTYLSASRAEEDKELLSETNPVGTYRVIAVKHIDN